MRRSPIRMLGITVFWSFLMVIHFCVPSGSAACPATDPSVQANCDRECLIGVLDVYLAALAANDPSRIHVADTLKYTDNGVAAELGQGLWTTATSVDNEKRLDFADPQQGNVASQVVIYEAGGGCGDDTPVIYQVRLKVAQHEIAEIESMTLRRKGAANVLFNVNNMAPQPVFNEPIPADQRMSRDELIAVLDLYVDYLEGKVKGAEVPFDTDCARYENGVLTANGIRAFELQSFWFFNVTRRYPVIDEEAGIVWGMLPFFQTDSSLVVGEAFKMIDGKIMMIQAVMAWMPAKAWD